MLPLSAGFCVFIFACLLSSNQERVAEAITPVLLAVQDAPASFAGSDGNMHLVYELQMTNFSSGNVAIEQVEVIGDNGAVVKTLNASDIAGRLQMAGQRKPTDVLPGSAEACLFIHVTLVDG